MPASNWSQISSDEIQKMISIQQTWDKIIEDSYTAAATMILLTIYMLQRNVKMAQSECDPQVGSNLPSGTRWLYPANNISRICF